MPPNEGQPGGLTPASGKQSRAASSIVEAAGTLMAAAAGAADAAGEGAAPGAIGAWDQVWASALQQLSGAVGATAGNAASAADAYSVTDAHAMPATTR